ncbi:hypothetical protein HC823_00170 [Candidatus Gracilibacteria bacterium]|nr:hypothetical protein [Candidatus Gracilibacteria bacterium]
MDGSIRQKCTNGKRNGGPGRRDSTKKVMILYEVQARFDEASAPFLIEEKQIFPEQIDIAKITKTLELLGLQLAVLDSTTTSEFELESLSFSATKKQRGDVYATTPVTMTVTTTDAKLQTFVEFIQSSELPASLVAAKDSLEPTTYKFLENNYLPIAHIESIKISEVKDSSLIKAQVSLSFFSQD